MYTLMMLGELLTNGDISTRLHNGLYYEFRKRIDESFENMEFDERCKYTEYLYHLEIFESMTLAEVLTYLHISKPEDILKFEMCGKKTVEDLRSIL